MATSNGSGQAAVNDFEKNHTEQDDYQTRRHKLLSDERAQSWDAPARNSASQVEQRAQEIIFKLRESERMNPEIFGDLPSEQVPKPETRDLGGRFLVNKPRIESKSKIFEIAKEMPKGCHQHVHFNCELQPEVLFPHARGPEVENTMCIRTTVPLTSTHAFNETEIVFKVVPENHPKVNVFSKDYTPGKDAFMLWSDFRKQFPEKCPPHFKTEAERDNLPATNADIAALDKAELWAREKMVVTKHDAYNPNQTHNGAWACFNQGTRAFKGLLGYEAVYRWYIGALIESMVKDKVMYAELRPMMMDKGLPTNDGTRMLNHSDQMEIIDKEMKDRKHLFPFGLKIIYCTPRSIPRTRADQKKINFPSCMEIELEDCLKLKLQFPDLICGFDLVGAEDRKYSISYYGDLLVAFQRTCEQQGVEIPFLFHAGESLLDSGGSVNPENSNLYDALLLKSKRIGHGYAILKHPLLVEKYKQNNICLELCPLSNELLHLCGNVRQHPYPQMLAAGLHCTISADNPNMYSCTLSHEFYQVMVGDPRMTIHGWKQLAQWSLEHSCLEPADKAKALEIHAKEFESFCNWVVEKFSEEAEEQNRKWLVGLY